NQAPSPASAARPMPETTRPPAGDDGSPAVAPEVCVEGGGGEPVATGRASLGALPRATAITWSGLSGGAVLPDPPARGAPTMQQRIVEAEVATGAARTRTSAAVRGQSR